MRHVIEAQLFAIALAATVVGVTAAGSATDAPSAQAALARLTAGNQRFAADVAAEQPIDRTRRGALATGQAPFAIVLSCADSRVPPETIFNVGLGDVFVVRAAGAVMDRAVLASVEHGAAHLRAPLLVVMGHEFCETVTAAIETTSSLGPNLDFLLQAIKPAVDRTAKTPATERLKAAVMANVEQVVNDGLGKSAILSRLVGSGQLTVVGAYYELESGTVTFSQPVSATSVGHTTGKAQPR